jgi:hypothetical protein
MMPLLLASKQTLTLLLVIGVSCVLLVVRARSSSSTAQHKEDSTGSAAESVESTTDPTATQPEVRTLLHGASASKRTALRFTVIDIEDGHSLVL